MNQEKISEFLVNHITDKVVCYIIEDEHIDLLSALKIWYSSKTFTLLQKPDGDLFSQSPSYIFELLKLELAK